MPTYNTQKSTIPTATVLDNGVSVGTTTVYDPPDSDIPRGPNYVPVFNNNEVSEDQLKCYSLRKTVMFLCGIDIVFGLLYSLSSDSKDSSFFILTNISIFFILSSMFSVSTS